MKILCTLGLIFLCVTALFSQEFIKNSTIHFKDSSVAKGDFYYYTSIPQSVTLVDSLGDKHEFALPSIDFVQGKADLYRVIDFNGVPNIYEAITEGEKASLYKTYYKEYLQLYILKDGKLTLLENGMIEFEDKGKSYRKENTRYKGTLKFLLSDNSDVVNKIDGIRYFESNITPLIIAYNNGHTSYLKNKTIAKQNRKPDWKIYAQFSNERSREDFFDNSVYHFNYVQAGAEYFLTEEGRHSFKFGVAHFQGDMNFEYWSFNTSYYYDTFKTTNSNVYLGIRLFDAFWTNNADDKKIHYVPRLLPLVGYEYHLFKKIDAYVEINNMFSFSNIPRNFTVGLSYDL